MSKITVGLTSLSDHEKDEFIKGFRSILAMDDYNDSYRETAWCCPWTYTDSLTMSVPFNKRNLYFALGRQYAIIEAPVIVANEIRWEIEDEIQECLATSDKYSIDTINDHQSKYLELQDKNDPDLKNTNPLSGIIFKITPYASQFIKAMTSLDAEQDIAYIRIKASSDVKKFDKNHMVYFRSDNSPANLACLIPTLVNFLDQLCEYAAEWSQLYVKENYAELDEQINHCGMDAVVEKQVNRKKAKTL